jgi:hypothetical protein
MPEKHKLPVEFRAPASTRENPGCIGVTAPTPGSSSKSTTSRQAVPYCDPRTALVALQSKAKTPVFRPFTPPPVPS